MAKDYRDDFRIIPSDRPKENLELEIISYIDKYAAELRAITTFGKVESIPKSSSKTLDVFVTAKEALGIAAVRERIRQWQNYDMGFIESKPEPVYSVAAQVADEYSADLLLVKSPSLGRVSDAEILTMIRQRQKAQEKAESMRFERETERLKFEKIFSEKKSFEIYNKNYITDIRRREKSKVKLSLAGELIEAERKEAERKEREKAERIRQEMETERKRKAMELMNYFHQ